jgi:hypothetical protein
MLKRDLSNWPTSPGDRAGPITCVNFAKMPNVLNMLMVLYARELGLGFPVY